MSILSASPNELIKVSESRIPAFSFILPFPLKKNRALSSALFPGNTLVTLHDTDSHHLFEVFCHLSHFHPGHAHSSAATSSSKTTACFEPFWLWGCLNPSGMMITLGFIPKEIKHMSMFPTHLLDYGYSHSRRRQWHPTPVLLPGKSHGWRSLLGCSPWGRKESDMTERLPFHFSLSCIGEGNGNPLWCSCLENPRDSGAWWAAIYGVHTVGHDWSDLAAAAAFS